MTEESDDIKTGSRVGSLAFSGDLGLHMVGWEAHLGKMDPTLSVPKNLETKSLVRALSCVQLLAAHLQVVATATSVPTSYL